METDKLVKGQQNDENKYIAFIEKHAAVFIAVASACVAVVSALINFTAYMYRFLSLQKWNIDASVLNGVTWNHTRYYILISFLYCLATGLLSYSLEESFTEYYKGSYRIRYIFYKAYIEKMREETREIHKKYKRISKKTSKGVYTGSKKREDAVSEKTQYKKIIKSVKEMEGEYRKGILYLLGIAILKNLPALFILLISIALFNMITSKPSFLYILLAWIVVWVFLMLVTYLSVYMTNKTFRTRKIRNRTRELYISGEQGRKKAQATLLEEYAAAGDGTAAGAGDNVEKLKNAALSVLSGAICMFFTVLAIGASTDNLHWIYDDGETAYIVVFNTGNTYVLEEAVLSEDGNTIYVDTDKQRILTSEDITLEYADMPVKKKKEAPQKGNSDNAAASIDDTTAPTFPTVSNSGNENPSDSDKSK